MRPIKFRWRALSDWRWVYGYYRFISESNTHQIIWWELLQAWADIDPDTLGQLTWLLDKNWKEIYEGDILSVKMWTRTKMSVIEWVQKSPRYDYEEEYSSLNWYVKFWNFEQKSLHPDWSAFALHEWNFEVIWNIYENLELLTKNLWA